jgi:DNA helicase II / ATP-dependent DNA helicase PcrA
VSGVTTARGFQRRRRCVEPRPGTWPRGGPWRVALVVAWAPWPTLWPRLAVRWRWHVAHTASAEGVLAAARRAFERADTPDPGPESVRDRWLEVIARDASGRVAWRARDLAAVRDAARELAGWRGAPPALPSPPPPGVAADRSGLTAAQQAVVDHAGGPAVVVAVAGAGKTTTMVARVERLVQRGAEPGTILVTSFSRAAIADVRRRLAEVAGGAAVEARTFHGLAHAIVSEAARRSALPVHATTGAPPPEAVVPRLVEHVLRTWESQGHPLAQDAADLDKDAFLAYRSRCLAELRLPDVDAWPLPREARRMVRPAAEDPAAPLHRPLAEAVEIERRARGWLDYDDLIVTAWAVLAGDPGLRDWARQRWRRLLVDEFQDVNRAQVALVEQLIGDDGEVMAIGDDDQSIYGFRGSDPALLGDFARRHDATLYVLDHNFRSRAEPLAAAAALAQHLRSRTPKTLHAARGPGGVLSLDVAPDPAAEARRLVERVLEAHRDGYPLAQQAVLLRAFAQAPGIEAELLAAGIRYRVIGAPSVDRYDATRATLAVLHLIADDGPADDPRLRARAWRRWLRAAAGAPRGAERLVPVLVAAERDGARSLRAALHDATEPRALRALRVAAGREQRGRLTPLVDALARVAAAARGGDALAVLRAAAATVGRWPRHDLESLAVDVVVSAAGRGVWGDPTAPAGEWLARFGAWRRAALASRGDALTVTSAHRSKGLEWDVVIVPGQALGTFPRREDDDERRLAYVAWTRARERLHLLRPAGAVPSPFLRQGLVDAVTAVQRDVAWLSARPASRNTLAGRWAQHDLERLFGAASPDRRRPSARTRDPPGHPALAGGRDGSVA